MGSPPHPSVLMLLNRSAGMRKNIYLGGHVSPCFAEKPRSEKHSLSHTLMSIHYAFQPMCAAMSTNPMHVGVVLRGRTWILWLNSLKASLHLERPSSLRTVEQSWTHGSEEPSFCPCCVNTFYQTFLWTFLKWCIGIENRQTASALLTAELFLGEVPPYPWLLLFQLSTTVSCVVRYLHDQ